MKFTFAAVAAIAAVANAQSACEKQAEALPPCAIGYLVNAASSIASCGLVDFACQCSASAKIQAAIVSNIGTACSDLGGVLAGAQSLCDCASSNSGQSIQVPQSQCEASAFAIPPCALGYLADAAATIGQCSLYDFACQCSNSAAVQSSIQSNVLSACGNDGVGSVLQAASALCACAGSGGGSAGGSSAKPTGASGGSGSGSGGASATPAAGSGGAAATSAPKQSGAGGAGATQPAYSTFTGGAAIPAIGGIMGAVAGLVAVL